MSQTLLTRIQHKRGTIADWSLKAEFVPLAGELIIYNDHRIFTDENGEMHNLPGFKVGDGVTALAELPFADEYMTQRIEDIINELEEHVNDATVHHTMQIDSGNSELLIVGGDMLQIQNLL